MYQRRRKYLQELERLQLSCRGLDIIAVTDPLLKWSIKTLSMLEVTNILEVYFQSVFKVCYRYT